ncbi:TPA: hypothetical protein G8O14_004295 [Salmonella enterica]|nr:hypothetical protein [Salmonella enterica subsp. enterica serovar Mikawasima]EDR9713702.1 hypothetical protein [Salmonella enterica subsp. diarizonae]EDV5614976.1 hypothetical protein [Salmonella enterica subsp. enterica serovar Anatum]HAF4710399.1 hypothetical protein [Salmonella enterica]EDS0148493.1 hypothetical protein [Salmonella enterica subsp. diarizonae]
MRNFRISSPEKELHKTKKMPLDVRKWTCSECGVAHGEPVNPEPQHAA